MTEPSSSPLTRFWRWARHVDRAVFHADRQAGLWPPNLRAVPGPNLGSSWRIRAWWMLVGLFPLGIVLLAGPAVGEPMWQGVLGGVLVVVAPIVAWRTARTVYGAAWEATKDQQANL